jgi:fucose 4-O-acetylase-like acetyltransferase
MNTEDENRILWLDGAKGISILLVAFHHAQLTAADIGHAETWLTQLNVFFRPIRMPLFFFLSGIFADRIIRRKWNDKLGGRVATLLYLYGLWTTISWVYYRIMAPYLDDYLLGRSLSQFLTMWIIPLSGQWFLWLLAIYFVLAKAVAGISSRWLLPMLCIATAIGVETIDGFPHYSWRNALLYAPFFLAGQRYGKTIIQWLPRRAWPTLTTSLALYTVAISLLGMEFVANSSIRHVPGVRLALSSLGLFFGLSATWLLCRHAGMKTILSYLGQHSLTIYLTHGLIMSLTAVILSQIVIHPWALMLMPPLLLVLAIPASLLLRLMLEPLGDRWLYTAKGPTKWIIKMRERALPSNDTF